MGVLDGSELSFVFTFAFLIGLWTRNFFAAPAVVSLAQYAVLWPLYFQHAEERDAVRFHVSHTLTSWVASAVGWSLASALDSPQMINGDRSKCGPEAVNIAILTLLALGPLSYVAVRTVLDPPLSVSTWTAMVVFACAIGRILWQRELMYSYFEGNPPARRFASAVFVVQAIMIASFAAIDMVFDGRDDDSTLGFWMRCTALAVLALAIAVSRRVPCLRKCWKCASIPPPIEVASTNYPLTDFDGLPRSYMTSLYGTDNETDDDTDRKTDDDYCEYHDTQLQRNYT